MAYTVPTTRATTNLITASIWNTDLVENIKFLANPPSCRVYHDATLSIANNTATTFGVTGATTSAFNSERWDTDSMHSTVTNPGRITFNTAGLYQVFASVHFAANSSGYRQVYIQLNGIAGPVIANAGSTNAGGTLGTGLIASTTYKFAAGDYIVMVVAQASGGALNIDSTDAMSPEFGATWIGLG